MTSTPQGPPQTPSTEGPLRRWTIAVGNQVFHTRNSIFPAILALSILVFRPAVLFNDPGIDKLLVACGVAVALLGQAIRLFTIGFEYIERGGKNRQIHASFLAQKGMYGLTRNPMYLGNALIAIGITMVAGSPSMYLVVLPFFLFVYHAIVAAEEAYLRGRFPEPYAQYCAAVPRWWPALSRAPQSFAGSRYDWRRAIRKDMSTLAGLFTGFILLPVWRTLCLHGVQAAKAQALRAIALELLLLAVFAFLHYLKKHRRFFYLQTD